MMIAERVRTDLHASRIPVGEGHLCRWAQAMTDYGAGSQAGPVLSRLDFGLMRAESAGNDQVVILGATDTQSPSEAGEQAWKQAIQSALEENRYELATEALTSANGSLVRTEAMLMLRTAADQMPIPPRSSSRQRYGWTWWPTATCRRWRWACNGWPRTKVSWPCASPCPRCVARNSSAGWPCC